MHVLITVCEVAIVEIAFKTADVDESVRFSQIVEAQLIRVAFYRDDLVAIRRQACDRSTLCVQALVEDSLVRGCAPRCDSLWGAKVVDGDLTLTTTCKHYMPIALKLTHRLDRSLMHFTKSLGYLALFEVKGDAFFVTRACKHHVTTFQPN